MTHDDVCPLCRHPTRGTKECGWRPDSATWWCACIDKFHRRPQKTEVAS